jgi:hypothetical protein
MVQLPLQPSILRRVTLISLREIFESMITDPQVETLQTEMIMMEAPKEAPHESTSPNPNSVSILKKVVLLSKNVT